MSDESDPKPETPTSQPQPQHRGLPNPLQKETDRVARPGFRNPPNTKSKAQKSKKKGR